MKNRKIEWNRFAFYDYRTIEEHLEEMAEKGWFLEQMGEIFWTYKRIEPKKLHFAVTYFLKDGYDTQEEKENIAKAREFCQQNGWVSVGRWNGMMQIFCNAEENPVPLETDPVVFVNSIHAAMKKGEFSASILFFLLNIYWGFQFVSIFRQQPSYVFQNPIVLLVLPLLAIASIFVLIQWFDYIKWHRKAVKTALEGRMPKKGKMKKIWYLPKFVLYIYAVFILLLQGVYFPVYFIFLFTICLGAVRYFANQERTKDEKKQFYQKILRNPITWIAVICIFFVGWFLYKQNL